VFWLKKRGGKHGKRLGKIIIYKIMNFWISWTTILPNANNVTYKLERSNMKNMLPLSSNFPKKIIFPILN
jgi:hypothetical protein